MSIIDDGDGSSSLPTTKINNQQHHHHHHHPPPPSKLTIYPLATALLATITLVISIYNTIDCQFLTVDIGFVPVNRVVDIDVLTIGLWRYVDPDSTDGRCRAYPDIFRSGMIEGELNWFSAQFAAVSGNVFGGISCFILWVMVFGGFHQSRKWKYTLCILSLYCAFAEGGRFFFFQIGLCQAEIWLKADTTSGSISIDTAKSCMARRGTFIALATMVLYLVHAVVVCVYGVVVVVEEKEEKTTTPLPVAVIRHIDKIDSVLMIPKSPDNNDDKKSRTRLLSKVNDGDDDDDCKNDSQRTASTCLSNDANATSRQPVPSSSSDATAIMTDDERCHGVLAAGLQLTSSSSSKKEGRRQQQQQQQQQWPHSSIRQPQPPSSSKKKKKRRGSSSSSNNDFVLPSARLIDIRESDDEFVSLKGKLFAKP